MDSDTSAGRPFGIWNLGFWISPKGRWVWFFIALAVLTVTAIVIEVWYNFHQQLTPAQLNEARTLWKAKGPHSYNMQYTQKTLAGEEVYQVQVRKGRVVASIRNGRPEEPRLYRYRDMPALFNFIEDFLERDSQPGRPRVYAQATFDPHDGHLLHYVRSVMSEHERQEITVQLEPLPKG